MAAPVKASDDLLQLSNPFADAFNQPQPVNTTPFMQPNNIWMANGNGNGFDLDRGRVIYGSCSFFSAAPEPCCLERGFRVGEQFRVRFWQRGNEK